MRVIRQTETRIYLAILMTLLMAISSGHNALPESDIGFEPELSSEKSADTSGRVEPGGLEAACGSLTFEDMFNYTFATFDVTVNQDWESAWVQAVAYVNGTYADQVRTDLDWLFGDQSLPGGGNNYLSSDERNNVEIIGRDCIEQTHTRLGFRAGPAHRGGIGVDWKNSSWTNAQGNMVLEEWNLLPVNHPNWRDCTYFGASPDCREIPVVPLNGRDCDTTKPSSEGVDECRTIIWLNGTVEWPSMNDKDHFTVGMNTTNMTNAEITFNFPPETATDPDTGEETSLRVAMFEECDGRLVDANPDNDGSAPTIGGCQNNDGMSHSSELIDVNGSDQLRVVVDVTYDFADWPTGQDFFLDVTTDPVPPNEAPMWTANAPNEGDLIPVLAGGNMAFMPWSSVAEWLADESGVGSLTITCTDSSGWSVSNAANGDWSVAVPTAGGMTTMTCEAVDDIGQSSGQRNWSIAVPFTITSTSTNLSNPHEFSVTQASDMPAMTVKIDLIQDGMVVGTASSEINSVAAISVSVDAAAAVPGSIQVQTITSGTGILTTRTTHDIDLTKSSSPPSVTVTEATWDGSSWSIRGQFSDPDGENVTFTMKIGTSFGGQITVTGNSWQSQAIDFEIWDEGEHTITIEACDTSNVCTTITEQVDNTFLFNSNSPNVSPGLKSDPDDGNPLPAPGVGVVLLGFIGALMYRRRRG